MNNMKDLYIYKYNKSGVLIQLEPVKSVQEQLSYKIETQQGKTVFPTGITNIPPPEGMSLYPKVSPIFDEATKTWTEDKEAVQLHLDSLKTPKEKTTAEYMVDLDYRLTLMELGVQRSES